MPTCQRWEGGPNVGTLARRHGRVLGAIVPTCRRANVGNGGGPVKVRRGEICAFRGDLEEEMVDQITSYMRSSLSPELNSMWQC